MSQENLKKNKLKLIFKAIIAVLLMVYLIKYVDYKAIMSAAEYSNKLLILFVFLLTFINVYFQFLKWELVCNDLLNIFDKKKIWLSLFYGFSGGIATPIRVGEYVGRKIPFDNVGLLKITITTILEKFTSLFMVFVFGGISAVLFLDKYYSSLYTLPIIIFIVFVVILASAVLTNADWLKKIISYLNKKFSFFEKILLEVKYVKQLGKASLIKLVVISFLFYLTYTFQFAILVLAFNNGGSILYAFWAGTMVMFAKSFFSFMTFADLGIRESASILLLDKMGFAKAVGFNSAIFLFMFNLLIPSIVGLFLLLKKDK